jgi:hypothetical protein
MFCNIGIPAWYTFYDQQVHKAIMHDLADIKGEKEFFYLELLTKQSAVNKLYSEIKSEKPSSDKPALQFDYHSLEFFINTFEDKTVVRYFYAAEKNHPDLFNNLEVDDALQILKNSDEEIPLHTNANWKDAVVESAKNYKTKKIAESLWTVYEQYNMRIKTQLPFYDESDYARQQLVLRNVEKYKKQILKARKLNGESANFNF